MKVCVVIFLCTYASWCIRDVCTCICLRILRFQNDHKCFWARMIRVLKKEKKRINCGHRREANLCETSPMPTCVRQVPCLVPKVGTLEDSNKGIVVHL